MPKPTTKKTTTPKSKATTEPKTAKKKSDKRLTINDLSDDLKAGYCQFGNKQECGT